MAQQIINVGSSPNDGTGDVLRVSQQKANANFTELYNGAGVDSVQRNSFTWTTGAQTFTLTKIPNNVVFVSVQGQVLSETQYTIVGTTLTILDTLDVGNNIIIVYNFSAVTTTEIKTGWANYTDTTYTSVSPFAVLAGATAILDNNANVVINSQLPDDTASFYDAVNNKITPTNVDDKYLINIRFKAKTNVVNDGLTVAIDIGGTQGLIVEESTPFIRGANIEQKFNFMFTAFSRDTFIANGGIVKVTALNGNLQIYDIAYVIERTHKPN